MKRSREQTDEESHVSSGPSDRNCNVATVARR